MSKYKRRIKINIKNYYCTGHDGKLELKREHLINKAKPDMGYKCVICDIANRPYKLVPITPRKDYIQEKHNKTYDVDPGLI